MEPELHQSLDKFDRSSDQFIQIAERIDTGEPDFERIELALAHAKRVRRDSNLVVRALARLRDQLQPGGTS